MIEEITLRTHKKVDLIDITSQIKEKVKKVKEGFCIIFVPHTTAAVLLNENADPSVISDIILQLDTLIPQESSQYSHAEGNSAAHIKSAIIGSSRVLLIEGGELVLGTWQGVFFCEFDGPRHRKVILKIISSG